MAKTLLTNSEVVAGIGLPEDILDELATSQGTEFQAKANQFISALVNKIVYSKVFRMTFSNPFAKYEGYPVEYGDTIENIFVELPKGYKFDKDATDPFAKVGPSVRVYYATINYEMQYCLTVQDVLLRRAVKSRYGLINLVENLIASLSTAKELDEYKATVAMLNNSELYKGGFETLDLSASATETATYKAITEKIITTAHDFCLPSKDNNVAGVMQVSSLDDVLLIIKQTTLDKINLDFLAGVFNLEKTELLKHIITVRSFQQYEDEPAEGESQVSVLGDDIEFVLVDSRAFDIHTALDDGGVIYNPKGKYTNHFTNLWKLISFKKFYNAKAFKVTYPSA